MRKLLSVMLGLSLLVGCATTTFAATKHPKVKHKKRKHHTPK